MSAKILEIVSPKFVLVSEDLKKWLGNALVFAAPALLVLIASIVQIVPADFKYGVFVLYVLNLLTDLLRKYVGVNTYTK
jgi:hypothetical protein